MVVAKVYLVCGSEFFVLRHQSIDNVALSLHQALQFHSLVEHSVASFFGFRVQLRLLSLNFVHGRSRTHFFDAGQRRNAKPHFFDHFVIDALDKLAGSSVTQQTKHIESSKNPFKSYEKDSTQLKLSAYRSITARFANRTQNFINSRVRQCFGKRIFFVFLFETPINIIYHIKF